MSSKYTLQCLDSRYDELLGLLVNFCFVKEIGEPRIMTYLRSDFTFHGKEVPHEEMHKTAELFRGKTYYQIMDEDPARRILTPEEESRYAKLFADKIGEDFQKIADGLSDDSKQMQRKLGRLADEGKLNALDLFRQEMTTRESLRGPE